MRRNFAGVKRFHESDAINGAGGSNGWDPRVAENIIQDYDTDSGSDAAKTTSRLSSFGINRSTNHSAEMICSRSLHSRCANSFMVTPRTSIMTLSAFVLSVKLPQ